VPALRARQTVFRQKTQDPFWQFCQFKGTQIGCLADFGPFLKREEKTKIRARTDSHGTRDSDAPTSQGGGAAGVPLRTPYRHAVLRIAAAFGPRTPHILRRSCAVSLQKRALKTARSRYGPDVEMPYTRTPPTGSAPRGRITCTALPKPPPGPSEGLA
jgi:hypothetical protein